MKIYEIGIIKNGLPLIRQSFENSSKFSSYDPLLISGFLQVLTDFIQDAFKDLPQTLRMYESIAIFYPIKKDNADFTFYAMCDESVNYKYIRQILSDIIDQIGTEIYLINENKPDDISALIVKKIIDDKLDEINFENRDNSFKEKLNKF